MIKDAIEKSLPVLSLENAKVGSFYKFCDGWMRVEEIYKVSEEYARENGLWRRDRVKVVDFNDNQWEFALELKEEN